jgi:hypothetical protein
MGGSHGREGAAEAGAAACGGGGGMDSWRAVHNLRYAIWCCCQDSTCFPGPQPCPLKAIPTKKLPGSCGCQSSTCRAAQPSPALTLGERRYARAAGAFKHVQRLQPGALLAKAQGHATSVCHAVRFSMLLCTGGHVQEGGGQC